MAGVSAWADVLRADTPTGGVGRLQQGGLSLPDASFYTDARSADALAALRDAVRPPRRVPDGNRWYP